MRVLLLIFTFLCVACAGPKPYKQYVISQTALERAKSAGAEAYAKAYWYKAESSYQKAQKYYKLNENVKAGKLFDISRKYSEKAEMLTRLKKFKSGDITP